MKRKNNDKHTYQGIQTMCTVRDLTKQKNTADAILRRHPSLLRFVFFFSIDRIGKGGVPQKWLFKPATTKEGNSLPLLATYRGPRSNHTDSQNKAIGKKAWKDALTGLSKESHVAQKKNKKCLVCQNNQDEYAMVENIIIGLCVVIMTFNPAYDHDRGDVFLACDHKYTI